MVKVGGRQMVKANGRNMVKVVGRQLVKVCGAGHREPIISVTINFNTAYICDRFEQPTVAIFSVQHWGGEINCSVQKANGMVKVGGRQMVKVGGRQMVKVSGRQMVKVCGAGHWEPIIHT